VTSYCSDLKPRGFQSGTSSWALTSCRGTSAAGTPPPALSSGAAGWPAIPGGTSTSPEPASPSPMRTVQIL